jgi:hypothetical protein
MKLFVYKSLFIFGCILLLYKFTIGQEIKKFEEEISHISSKENITNSKNKIKEELNAAISKDRILKREEAILIKKFINKIKKELDEVD